VFLEIATKGAEAREPAETATGNPQPASQCFWMSYRLDGRSFTDIPALRDFSTGQTVVCKDVA
jgi:hypothetical protein